MTTPADAELRLILEQMARAKTASGELVSLEAHVLAHGRAWTPCPLPRGIRRGKPKECFTNALTLVSRHPDLRYVEGFAWRHADSRHAWCVDAEDRVIDPTWVPVGGAYLGIVFDRPTLARWVDARPGQPPWGTVLSWHAFYVVNPIHEAIGPR